MSESSWNGLLHGCKIRKPHGNREPDFAKVVSRCSPALHDHLSCRHSGKEVLRCSNVVKRVLVVVKVVATQLCYQANGLALGKSAHPIHTLTGPLSLSAKTRICNSSRQIDHPY